MANLCETCHSLFASLTWYNSGGKSFNFPDHQRTPSQVRESANQGCRICSVLQEASEADALLGKTCNELPDEYFTVCNMYPIDNGFLMNFYLNYSNSAEQGLVQFKVIPALDDSWINDEITECTDSVESFRFITESIKNCSTNHPACCASIQTGWAPTRVLDLVPFPDSDVLRLVETKGNQRWPSYATLSHCWGAIKPAQLLQATRSSMLNSIQLDDLPKTFKDAIHITRTLGFRYLWIDSLCIIQDSAQDWLNESMTMEKVYKCSALNIAASDATDSSGGCFKKRNPQMLNHYSFTLQVDGSPKEHWLVEGSRWKDFLENSPLYQRAWVLQESLLSPRILHCSRRHLIWECKEHITTELFPRGVPEQFGFPQYSRLRKFVHETDPVSAGIDLMNPEVAYTFCQSWSMLVMSYTGYGITKPSDKLIALAGIAASLKPTLGDYHAGLWKLFLPWGLMWHVQYEFGRPANRSTSYRAPTWSWASVDGRVVLNPLDIGEKDGEDGIYLPKEFPSTPAVSIVDIQVKTTDSNGIGQVISAFMDIRGRPVRILLDKNSRDKLSIRFENPRVPGVATDTSRAGKRSGRTGWIQSLLGRLGKKREEVWGTNDDFKFTRRFDDRDFKYDNPTPLQLIFLPLFMFPPDVSPSRFAAGLLLQSDGEVFRRVGTLRVRGDIFHGQEERLLRIV